MENKYIESYIKFLDMKCAYKKEYIDDYNCVLIDEHANIMQIMNFFEDVLVSINNEKIGCFTQRHDRADNSEIWVCKIFN